MKVTSESPLTSWRNKLFHYKRQPRIEQRLVTFAGIDYKKPLCACFPPGGIDLGVDISDKTDKAQRGDAPIPVVHIVSDKISREALCGAQSERHYAINQFRHVREGNETSNESVPDQDNDHQRICRE
jgi:hypothetical protein